ELTREGAGALARAPDLVEVVARLVLRAKPRVEDIGVTEDRRQDVVEIVCDSARHPPHRLHLLCLPELFLELVALADVANDARHGRHAAIVGVRPEKRGLPREQLAVPPAELERVRGGRARAGVDLAR